jgi:hypothetical protein
MLTSKLISLVPSSILRAISDTLFGELVKRGEIKLPGQTEVVTSNYGVHKIELYTEQDATYTTTWAVYRGDDLLCEGDDDFYSSLGEAERAAIKWIETCCQPTSIIRDLELEAELSKP